MICKIISIRINSYPQDDSSTKDSSPNFNSLSVQTDRQFSRYKLNNTLTNFTYLLLASTFPILYGLRKDFNSERPLNPQESFLITGLFLLNHLSF